MTRRQSRKPRHKRQPRAAAPAVTAGKPDARPSAASPGKRGKCVCEMTPEELREMDERVLRKIHRLAASYTDRMEAEAQQGPPRPPS